MASTVTVMPSTQKGKEGTDGENLEVSVKKNPLILDAQWMWRLCNGICDLCSTARSVHLPYITCLQKLYTGKLFILVSNGSRCFAVLYLKYLQQCASFADSILKIYKKIFGHCLPLQVCNCGVWGSGHTAERPQNPWHVPQCNEAVQSGSAQGTFTSEPTCTTTKKCDNVN